MPHAGETTGPETIWDALRVPEGAERIGHGTAATQDPALVDHLAEHRIALEVCPTSNVATRVVAVARGAPDPRRWSTPGWSVTINTDDPPMFGTNLNNEYAVAAGLLDLDDAGVAELARTAVRSPSPTTRQGSAARRDRRVRGQERLTRSFAGGPLSPQETAVV